MSHQSKVALMCLWLCLFAFMINFTIATFEFNNDEEDHSKNHNDHDLFKHPDLKDFFNHFHHKQKPKPYPKPEPKPCLDDKDQCSKHDDKPKTKPKPCLDEKDHCSKHDDKPKTKPKPCLDEKDHCSKHDDKPKTKPQPQPQPSKKPTFHFNPLFKKPFFSHPKKPISP